MTDPFDEKILKPMLIGETGEAFDSSDYIHELKLDGIRCLAYLGDDLTELRNKRNLRVSTIYPELSQIHEQVKGRCILDGEVFVMQNGKPYFAEIKRRALMSNPFKISLAAQKLPVSFTAFDIVYKDGELLNHLPLMQRKEILSQTVTESERLSVSRIIDTQGIALYRLTEEQGLEGIVSKRKDSKYYFDKRTKDWIKVKNLLDEDFVVCGYITKAQEDRNVTSLILGTYNESGQLVNQGHVTLGLSKEEFGIISRHPALLRPPFETVEEGAVYIQPALVCTVKYMERTSGGGLRQPVFKGLRYDKDAKECAHLG